jgi:hypothetical protein
MVSETPRMGAGASPTYIEVLEYWSSESNQHSFIGNIQTKALK